MGLGGPEGRNLNLDLNARVLFNAEFQLRTVNKPFFVRENANKMRDAPRATRAAGSSRI